MEQGNIKKSIFRQRTYAKEYEFNSWYNYEIAITSKYNKLLKDELVCECDMSLPLLSIGEDFYIEKTSEMTRIDSVTRTSGDNVLYYIASKFENDTEEEMQKSYNIAEDAKRKYFEDKVKNEEQKKIDFEIKNKQKYLKEGFLYRLLNKYDSYNYTER